MVLQKLKKLHMNETLIELVTTTIQLTTYQEGGDGFKIPPAVLAKALRMKINEAGYPSTDFDSVDLDDMSAVLRELSESLERMVKSREYFSPIIRACD